MKTKTAISKITSLLLAFALVLGFAPTLQVSAAGNVTIDLGTVTTNNAGYHYDPVTGLITVRAAHAGSNNTVTISGDGTNSSSGYSIVIEAAQNITIADGTKIEGTVFSAGLSVPAGATISGGGSGITITGGSSGMGGGSSGISATGSITISGTVSSITGSSGSNGISATGSITISGTVSSITGGSSGTGNGGNGISSTGAVTITGKTGTIKGGVATSSGADGKDISAASYSVLDYTTAGNNIDISNCLPANGSTITFNYGGVTPDNLSNLPVRAHVSDGGKIPALPTEPQQSGNTFGGWYTDTALTIPWVFATDTIDSTVTTLYGKWSSHVAPTIPQSFTATAGDTKADLAWVAPASDGGSPITKYEVQKDSDSWVTAATNTSHSFTGLTNGTPYTFKVRAVNAIGGAGGNNGHEKKPLIMQFVSLQVTFTD